jgi:hypothetical protein
MATLSSESLQLLGTPQKAIGIGAYYDASVALDFSRVMSSGQGRLWRGEVLVLLLLISFSMPAAAPSPKVDCDDHLDVFISRISILAGLSEWSRARTYDRKS